MNTDEMNIDLDVFRDLGITKEDVIKYIENKKATTLKPIHVNSYQYLKNQKVVTS